MAHLRCDLFHEQPRRALPQLARGVVASGVKQERTESAGLFVVGLAVFGVPDERLGEQVAAWIQLHRGEHATEDEIRQFCKDRIAHFKIPRYIRFVDELPMTVTGKAQKFKMREAMLEQ